VFLVTGVFGRIVIVRAVAAASFGYDLFSLRRRPEERHVDSQTTLDHATQSHARWIVLFLRGVRGEPAHWTVAMALNSKLDL